MAWVESRSNQDRDCMIYCLWGLWKIQKYARCIVTACRTL